MKKIMKKVAKYVLAVGFAAAAAWCILMIESDWAAALSFLSIVTGTLISDLNV